MSSFPTVAVIVGAIPDAHFTDGVAVNVAVVGVPVAGCLRHNENDFPDPTAGNVNVQGVADVSVAVITVPAVIDSVAVDPTVPCAIAPSV